MKRLFHIPCKVWGGRRALLWTSLWGLLPGFLWDALASCPKCGGRGVVPEIKDCTNSVCRKGVEIKYIQKYDALKKRKVTDVITSPCRCCGGFFELPSVGTNETQKIQVPRGKVFTGFKSCERCGNIVLRRSTEITKPLEIVPVNDSVRYDSDGIERTSALPKNSSRCKRCSGKGYVFNSCDNCSGSGYIHVLTNRDMGHNVDRHGRHKTRLSNCPKCRGSGRRGQLKSQCPDCGGKGSVTVNP